MERERTEREKERDRWSERKREHKLVDMVYRRNEK